MVVVVVGERGPDFHPFAHVISHTKRPSPPLPQHTYYVPSLSIIYLISVKPEFSLSLLSP